MATSTVTDWDEIEADPDFSSLPKESRAKLFDDWEKKFSRTLLEGADLDKVKPEGLNRLAATNAIRRRKLSGEDVSDPNTAVKSWSEQKQAEAKLAQQTLKDYAEVEDKKFRLRDAQIMPGVDEFGQASPEWDRGVQEASKNLKAAESKFTPEARAQAQAASEALKGKRKIATLNGNIYTDPALVLNKEEFRQQVLDSDAPPEAKALKLASFQNEKKRYLDEAINTLTKGDPQIPLAESFPKFLESKGFNLDQEMAKQSEGKLDYSPIQKQRELAQEYLTKMQDRGWFRKIGSAISTGVATGMLDIGTQAVGMAAMATGDEETSKVAAELSRASGDIGAAQGLEGDMQATGGTFAGGLARLGTNMAPMLLPGGAVGGIARMAGAGAGAATAAAVGASALTAGAQTAGSQFGEVYDHLRQQGKTHEQAFGVSRNAAVLSGAVTTALTALGGATGVESLLRQGGKDLVKSRLVAAMKAVPGGAAAEIAEELPDEYVSQLVSAFAKDPNASPSQVTDEFAANAPDLILQIAALGGAGSGVSRFKETTTDPTKAGQPTPADDFAQRAAMEGATEYRAPEEAAARADMRAAAEEEVKKGIPVEVEGVTIATIPPESDMTPEDVLDFANSPEDMAMLARNGKITLPEVVAPIEGVDLAITEEMNERVAASAALAPQTVEALKTAPAPEAQAETAEPIETVGAEAAETPVVEPVEEVKPAETLGVTPPPAPTLEASEGAARNADIIRQARARMAGTEQGPRVGLIPQPSVKLNLTPDESGATGAGMKEEIQQTPAETEQEKAKREYQEYVDRVYRPTWGTTSKGETAETPREQPQRLTDEEMEKIRSAAAKGRSQEAVDEINRAKATAPQPITPTKETPTPATEGTVMPGGSAMERDVTKPEQMTPEEFDQFVFESGQEEYNRTGKNAAMRAGTRDVLSNALSATNPVSVALFDAETARHQERIEDARSNVEKIQQEPDTPGSRKATRLERAEEKLASLESNQLQLPEGYVKQGDLYVFQPSSEKSDLGAGAATTPSKEPLKVTTPEAGKSPQTTTVATEWTPTVNAPAAFTANNGQKLVGTVQSIEGGKAVVSFSWNGQTQKATVRPDRLSSPVASLVEPPRYQYTQEQNTRKMAKHFPSAPGVHANHDFRKSFASMAKDASLSRIYRQIAKELSKMSAFANVDLHVVADENTRYAGEYSHSNGKSAIAVNLRQVGRGMVDALGTILHEALHHVTLAKVRDPQGAWENEVFNKLDTIREKVLEYAKEKGLYDRLDYELDTVEEFISALTNPNFQNFLASIPDSFSTGVSVGKFRSVLSEVFRLIAEWIKGEPVARGSTMEQYFTTVLATFETPHRAWDTGKLEALNAVQSMAGERAEMPQFMRDSLDTAKAMAAAGKTSEEIRAVTGWFPGRYDGKMRWEIPDNGAAWVRGLDWKEAGKASAKPSFYGAFSNLRGDDFSRRTLPLSDILNHPALYEAYPDLKDVEVQTMNIKPAKAAWGPAGITIDYEASPAEAMTSLIHEIQHWVQDKEGFARGSNPDEAGFSAQAQEAFLKQDPRLKAIAERQAAIKVRRSVLAERLKELGEERYKSPEAKEAAALDDEFSSLIQERGGIERGMRGNIGYELYRRTAGEIEARDVQARRNFTPEQRKAVAPYSSENIVKEDAIVMFGGNGPQESRGYRSPTDMLAEAAQKARGETVGTKPQGLASMFNPQAKRPATGERKLLDMPKKPEPVRLNVRRTKKTIETKNGPVTVGKFSDSLTDTNAANGKDAGSVLGTVDISDLTGVLRLNQPEERRRVDALKAKILSEEGFISPIIVSANGEVIEGQHRLAAMRELGATEMPVAVSYEAADFIPDVDALKKALSGFSLRQQQVDQLVGNLAEMLKDEKGDANELSSYDMPKPFDAVFKAAVAEVQRQFGVAAAKPLNPQSVGHYAAWKPRKVQYGYVVRNTIANAYREAVRGTSTQMAPLSSVYAQARLLQPGLTPEAFLAQVQEGYDNGTLLLEGAGSQQEAAQSSLSLPGTPVGTAVRMMPAPQGTLKSKADDMDAEYMAAVESGDVAKQQAMVNAAAKAAVQPFSTETKRTGFTNHTKVRLGSREVSVFRDPENGYWYFADKGGLGDVIAMGKQAAIKAAIERLEEESGGAQPSTEVLFRDWRKDTTITLPGFYLRFGDLPKGGKSVKGHEPGLYEKGVSVLKAWRSPDGVYVISSVGAETGASDMVAGMEGRSIYIAYGEDTGEVGSDGEPLLKNVVLTELVMNNRVVVDDPSYIDQPITNNISEAKEWETISPAPDPLAAADPVTRDKQGNVIPPPQRFNPKSNSTLYSKADDGEPPIIDIGGEAEPADGPEFAFTRARFAPPKPEDQMYQVHSDEEATKKAFAWINAVGPLRAADLLMADRAPSDMDLNVKNIVMGGLLKGFTEISIDPNASEDEKTVARATNQRLGKYRVRMNQDAARGMRQIGVQNGAVLQLIAPILAVEEVLADHGEKILEDQFEGGSEGAAPRVAGAAETATAEADERLENIIRRLMGSLRPKQTSVGALARMFRGMGQRDQIIDEVAKALMLKARGNVVAPERKTALANLVSSLKSTLAASVKGEKKPAPERTLQDLLTSAFVNQVSEGPAFESAWKEGRQKVLDMLIDMELDKTFHPAQKRLADLRAKLTYLEAGSAEQQEASAAERAQLADQIKVAKVETKAAMDAVKAMTPQLEAQRDALMPAAPTVAFDPVSSREAIGRAFEKAGYTADLATGLDKSGKRTLSIKDALLNRQRAADAVIKVFDAEMQVPDAATQNDWPQARALALKAVNETLDSWQAQTDADKVAKLEAAKQSLLSEDSKALEKLVNSIRNRILPDSDWSDILYDLPRTQAERLAAIKDRVAKHEALKNLTPDESKKLAESIDKLWQRERLKAFQDELFKAGVLKAKTTKAVANVASAAPELLRLMNLGVFNSSTFREAISKRFGLKLLTGVQADALRKLAAEAWGSPQGVLRNQKLGQLVEGIQHATGANWADVMNSYWIASVLSGLRTHFDTWGGVVNGLGTNLIQAGVQLSKGRGVAAFDIQAQWWKGLFTGLNEALYLLRTGDPSFTKRFEADLIDALNGEKTAHPIAIGEKMWKSGSLLQKIPGALMMVVGRSMVAADHVNNTATTQGAMAVARAMNPELYEGKTSWTQKEIADARKQAIAEATAGAEPATKFERMLVAKRTREILNAGLTEADQMAASEVGDIAAFQNDPTGLFGGLYHAVKSGLSSAVRSLDQVAQDEEAAKITRAFAAVTAGSVHALTGTRFMRFGFNLGNEFMRYMPGSWLLNKGTNILGSKLSPMQQDMLIGKNVVGGILLATLYSLFGDDDESEDGKWHMEGPWNDLSLGEQSSRLSAGLAKNSFWRRKDGKIERISYAQWPTAGLLAAVGSMLDEKRYKPEDWNQRGVAGHILQGAVTGLFQVQDAAAMQQVAELFSTSSSYGAAQGMPEKVIKMGTNYLGGLVPTSVKDLDKWQDPRNFRADGVWEKLVREMPVARRFVNDGRPQFNRIGQDVRLHREPYSRLYTTDEADKATVAYGQLLARGIDFPTPSTKRQIIKDGKKVPMDTLGKGVTYDFEKAVALSYGKFLQENGERITGMSTKALDKLIRDRATRILDIETRKVQAKVNNP